VRGSGGSFEPGDVLELDIVLPPKQVRAL
jgi:hypothetical protein